MAIAFERVIIIVLENAARDTVLQNPYMSELRKQGVFLKNSRGVTHPSQPNYFALTGGDTLGFNCDSPGWVQWYNHEETNPPLSITSIVDLLENKGLTWKAYAEDLEPSDIVPFSAATIKPPQECAPYGCSSVYTPPASQDHGYFARRHVPFLSYPNIVNNEARKQLIVPATQFDTDLAAGKLPTYSFYTPNLINDGHSLPDNSPAQPLTDQGQLKNIASFLQKFLGDEPLKKFPPETLLVITFDEAYPVSVPYCIYTLLICDTLPAGTTRTEAYNHYSLLRTIEDNFGLGTLGRNDDAATPYWFINP